MKRVFNLACLLLCLALAMTVLLACNPVDPDETPGQDQSEQPEPSVPQTVDVLKDGATAFRVVRGDLLTVNDTSVKAAVTLRQTMADMSGAKVGIVTDYEKSSVDIPEILVGETNRPISAQMAEGLAENEFVVCYDGKDIVLIGKTQYGTQKAVEYFMQTYFGYNVEDGTVTNTNVSVPIDLNYRGSFPLPTKVYYLKGIQNIGWAGNNEDYNDVVRLYTCLQGSLNKKAAENGFYIYQMDPEFGKVDDFWLEYIMGPGKLLADAEIVELSKWSDLWDALGSYIQKAGIVLWDPSVPATSNVASTICSVEGYLPVRYDTDKNSLYSWLTEKGVEVKMDLCGMFNDAKKGSKIADTDIDSTGSIKCDPYLWALQQYGDRVNPEMVAYTLDGASQVQGNPIYDRANVSTGPGANQLYSHDYYIYNECFFVDLTCRADEAPCDDPTQELGTDAKTLGTILGFFQNRNNGKFGKLMGFPPWYMKYTKFNDWGKSGEVELEWMFVAFITGYDFIKEADAWHPSHMTNASLYCQYEMTTEKFENNDAPLNETFDDRVRYFTVYIGDYDSSAWLKMMVPDCFESKQRGQIPMMWAFNPNLSDRVPMIFDYVYENKTENDYFVTGDSGAGYVFPSRLADLDKWVEYNQPYLEKFDMDIVGFIIDDQKMTLERMEAYAKITPLGGFVNTGNYLTVLNDETVFLRMWGSIQPPHNTDETREGMYNEIKGSGTNFAAYRTIRQYTPGLVSFVKDFIEFAEAKNDKYSYQYVDMYTLFDLILQSGQGKHVYSK
ncbi:MAG: hypothetical protein IJY66_05585 [Clostridia bacterium]|nr:hypothetical protein [Clostridia bacterium]